MKVLEPIITTKPTNIYIEDVFIQNNSISGDKIDGGTITNFRSDGIKDTAKNKQIIIPVSYTHLTLPTKRIV